jgi:hypothetical protein
MTHNARCDGTCLDERTVTAATDLRLHLLHWPDKPAMLFRPSFPLAPDEPAAVSCPIHTKEARAAAPVAERLDGTLQLLEKKTSWCQIGIPACGRPACPKCGAEHTILSWQLPVRLSVRAGRVSDVLVTAAQLPHAPTRLTCNDPRKRPMAPERLKACEGPDDVSVPEAVRSGYARFVRAFASGVAAYRLSSTTSRETDEFREAYDAGRAWAHQLTGPVHDDCVA